MKYKKSVGPHRVVSHSPFDLVKEMTFRRHSKHSIYFIVELEEIFYSTMELGQNMLPEQNMLH